LGREKPLGVGGHVAVRQKPVFGFKQHFAGGIHQNGAERVIAVRLSALRDRKTSAQKFFVIE